MLRAISLVLLFAALPGICSAGDPPVLPPLEIPVLADADVIQLDGDLTDWRQVTGAPTCSQNVTYGRTPQSPTMRSARSYFLDRDLDCRAAAGSRARRLRANRS